MELSVGSRGEALVHRAGPGARQTSGARHGLAQRTRNGSASRSLPALVLAPRRRPRTRDRPHWPPRHSHLPSRPARRRGAGRRGDFTPRPTPPRAVSHTDGVAMEPTAGEALPQPRGARGTADGQRRGAPGGAGAEGPRKGSAGGPRKDAQSCGCRKVGKRRLRVTCRARGWCLRPAPVVTPAVRSALPQHPCFNGRDTQARSWWQGRCWKPI